MGLTASFTTAGDAAAVAARMVAAGEPMRRVWKFVLTQVLDDYESQLRHRGIEAAAAMWQEVPEPTGDTRVDAALAAMAEYLGPRDGWRSAAWTRDPRREAVPWWFVTDLRGYRPQALVESPSSFRRRGIFITSGALERV